MIYNKIKILSNDILFRLSFLFLFLICQTFKAQADIEKQKVSFDIFVMFRYRLYMVEY